MIKKILGIALILSSGIYASEDNKKQQMTYLLAANGIGCFRPDIAKECGLIPQGHKSVIFEGDNILNHGQERDFAQLNTIMNNIKTEIVGIGQCDGAAAWINLASTLVDNNQLRALVLVAPYADAENLYYKTYLYKFLPFGKYIDKINDFFAMKALSCKMIYNPDGMQPIKSIKNIKNKDLPILMIDPKKYGRFEYSVFKDRDAYVLYKELIDQGFKNVYILDLKGEDLLKQKNYVRRVINLFYKQFSLPYYQIFSGSASLMDLKPGDDTVDEKIKPNTFELHVKVIKVINAFITLYIAYMLINDACNMISH